MTSKISFIVVFFLALTSLVAQEVKVNKGIAFEKGEEYIIGGISVTGLQKFEESTVRVYSGLRAGQAIKLPGDKLSVAIKKLYESKQFSDIDVYLDKLDGNKAYLRFHVIELPKIKNVTFSGVSKSKGKDLQKEASLTVGAMLTDNLIVTSRNYITKKYNEDGYLKAKVSINSKKDKTDINAVDLNVHVDRGNRIRIKDITFKGNKKLSDSDLRGVMSNTKRRAFWRFWKSSKYIEEKYKEDLESILERYSELGYRDARIISDKLTWNENNTINLEIEVEEGAQYRFGDILFVGNKIFTKEQLNSLLRIDKGDVYNGKVLRERVNGDPKDPDSECIQTLYNNNGYAFASVVPVETKVHNDSITVEVRIREDEIAKINKVTVSGNEKTNDHVIYRELRIKPGDVFSREKLIRSIRELGQLGFFDPAIQPDVKTNYQDKTIDVGFPLAEKGGSQIELQGGYGGGSFIGTLGLSFNNFSIKNIFNAEAYRPLPMGDGQRLSLRAQVSRSYNTYSFSFMEPWLGGKKPQAFSFSVYLSNQYQYNFRTYQADKDKSLQILGTSIGLSQRLQWPDDYFGLSQSISFQRIKLNDYGYRVGTSNDILNEGTLNNLAYNIGLSRNASGPSPIFPTYGSEFSINAKATLPYSLINKRKFIKLENPTMEEKQNYLKDKYKWLEYYKISFGGKWYTKLAKDFVLMTNYQMGYLGSYNEELGLTPVERYFVGGDGLAQGSLDGREVIGLRGYTNNSLSPADGSAIYNKYQLEFRYSITQKQTASIFTLAFLEAGNSYNNFKSFQPFKLKRSAGVGVRVFMSAFGLLGIDFAHGFDSVPGGDPYNPVKSGWQTHFIMSQRF